MPTKASPKKKANEYLSLPYPVKNAREQIDVIDLKLRDLFGEASPERIVAKLPYVKTELKEGRLSMLVLAYEEKGLSAKEFILDLLRFHLVPERTMVPTHFHSRSFHFIDDAERPLYLFEMMFEFAQEKESETARVNLPYLVQTLEKAVCHPVYARMVLRKDLQVPGSKDVQIHQQLLGWNARWPESEEMILQEMQVFFPYTAEEFRHHRSARGVAKIIRSLAWLRRRLHDHDVSNGEALICFRAYASKMIFTFGEKPTLCLSVGVSRLGDYQMFNEHCLAQVVAKHLPGAQLAKGSFLSFHRTHEPYHLFHVEIEKKNGGAFSSKDIAALKQDLLLTLEGSIEEVVPTVLMMRNEEEIFKNMLVLRNELGSMEDDPQVIISLETQTHTHLTFFVTMVWIAERAKKSLYEYFDELGDKWEFIPDRRHLLSKDGDEFTKEGFVFRLIMRKDPEDVRTNFSVNLHKAREVVVSFLEERLGPVRDYTGGMIVTQNNLFMEFCQRHKDIKAKNPDLLDDFFYNFSPPEKVISMSAEGLDLLFQYFLELLDQEIAEDYVAIERSSEEAVYFIFRFQPGFGEEFDRRFRFHDGEHFPVTLTKVKKKGFIYFAYVFQSRDQDQRIAFTHQVKITLREAVKKEQDKQVLRLGIQTFPSSFDPRTTMYVEDSYCLYLLFEGLMRLDSDGNPQYAIAKSHTVSEDQKTYTFKLKETFWSNGDPVTAENFAYAWKKVLSPDFKTRFIFPFFCIKNAVAVKHGQMPEESLGIYAKDNSTLVIELSEMIPYFLRYLTLNIFFPVNSRIDKAHPDWPLRCNHDFVCNGPFQLTDIITGKWLALSKNPSYWDQKHVRLERIEFSAMRLENIHKNFQAKRVDWLGTPLTNWEKEFEGCEEEKFLFPGLHPYFLIVNTQEFPWNNKAFRQAIFYSIDRKKLLQYLPLDAQVASEILPSNLGKKSTTEIEGDPEKARRLFAQALEELGTSLKNLPEITLIYGKEKSEIRDRYFLELVKQINEVLGVKIKIITAPWETVLNRAFQRSYQLCLISWVNLVDSPFYFLDALQSKQSNMFLSVASLELEEAIALARREKNAAKLKKQLSRISALLMDELPVLPLYGEKQHYVKNPRLKGVKLFPKIGVVDFKEAFLKSIAKGSDRLIYWG